MAQRGFGDASLKSLMLASTMAGLSYVLLCSIVGWISSAQHNADFIKAMLLLSVPEDIFKFFRSEYVVLPNDISFIAGIGVSYGVLCLMLPIFLYMVPGYKAPRFITSVWGFFLGYQIMIAFVDLANIERLPHLSYGTHAIKIFYLYVTFILFNFVREYLTIERPWKPQIGMLFDGFYGVLSSLIIVYGYGEGLASLLLGPVFLAAVFVSMFISEFIFTRSFLAMIYTIDVLERGKTSRVFANILHSDANVFIRFMRGFLFIGRTFVNTMKLPIEHTVSKFHRMTRFIANKLPIFVLSGVDKIDYLFTLSIFVLLMIWPWIGLLLFRFVVRTFDL